jgi:thiamine monophosphate synthase
MFIIKKKYYLYIDNTNLINFDLLNRHHKFIIIYRNYFLKENIKKMILFKKKCDQKKIKFYIANDYNLAKKCKANGLYLSSYNKKIYHNIEVIGSAHNYKEINQKINQGCRLVILSRLFKTHYKEKSSFFGVTKFNLMTQKNNITMIPLGGINNSNLLKLNLVNSRGLAILSSLKKKPVITNRLF